MKNHVRRLRTKLWRPSAQLRRTSGQFRPACDRSSFAKALYASLLRVRAKPHGVPCSMQAAAANLDRNQRAIAKRICNSPVRNNRYT